MKLKRVQRGAANVTQDLGELPSRETCDELDPVRMVNRKLRMGFDRSTSTVWERGHQERPLERLWLVELALPSCSSSCSPVCPGTDDPPRGRCLQAVVCQ